MAGKGMDSLMEVMMTQAKPARLIHQNQANLKMEKRCTSVEAALKSMLECQLNCYEEEPTTYE